MIKFSTQVSVEKKRQVLVCGSNSTAPSDNSPVYLLNSGKKSDEKNH